MFACMMNANVSKEKTRVYADVFHLMDTNRDGKISANELRRALLELGHVTTLEQAAKMVELVDENDDGLVEFNEFVHMAERTALWSRPEAEDDILAAFKTFDLDNDGIITADELQQAMVKMGQPLTRKEAKGMLEAMDKNGDGRVSYREFVTSWRQMMAGQ